MTKWALVLIICSFQSNTCMPPFEYPIKYNDGYDCMVAGYKESLLKTEQIGRKEINEYNIYIKFGCTPVDII